MKYQSKENDTEIEIHEDELWISVIGDSKCGKIVIGLNDLFSALKESGALDDRLPEDEILKESNSRQLEGVEPYSWAAGARWAKKYLAEKK
jgi:hypothetical protein